jgi:hypothetical protein
MALKCEPEPDGQIYTTCTALLRAKVTKGME